MNHRLYYSEIRMGGTIIPQDNETGTQFTRRLDKIMKMAQRDGYLVEILRFVPKIGQGRWAPYNGPTSILVQSSQSSGQDH